MTLFSRRTGSSSRGASSARAGVLAELTLQARAVLDVDDDTVVSISEHDCGDPGCGEQTVILVLRPGQPTRAVTIAKRSESVTRDDLLEALLPPAATARPHPAGRAPRPHER
jgi:hypothetical protein